MKCEFSFKLILIFLAALFLVSCGQPPTALNSNNASTPNQNTVNHIENSINKNVVNSNANKPVSANTNSAVDHDSDPLDSDEDTAEMLESSPDAAAQPFDLQFIDTMIQHHQAAIVIAKLASVKSQNQELRKFAQKLIAVQEAEIEKMESWRDKWYPFKLDAINMELPGMRESMKRMVGDDVDKMQTATGKEFDNNFIEIMIPHHQGAVTMAKAALETLQHQELKGLAQEIIREQEEEINLMMGWKEK